MATGTVMPSPKFVGYDNNGDPLSGGKLYTYAAGTTTPQTTYSDVALSVPNANPIILDAAGRATVFLSGTSYKFVLAGANDSVVWTQDNVSAVAPFSVNLDIPGTAGEYLPANAVVYLSDGSGSKTAGQWYLADADFAYASTGPQIGMTPDVIALGASGSIRVQGRATTASAVVVGSTYYVSTTAGGVVTPAPGTNARVVGVADSASTLVISPNPAALGLNPTFTTVTATSSMSAPVFAGSTSVSAPAVSATTSLTMGATNKFYLDGGGDTYLTESSANNVSLQVGGGERVSVSTSLVNVTTGLTVAGTTTVGAVSLTGGASATVTTTGTINDLATGLTFRPGVEVVLRMNNASDATITGVSGGVDGAILSIISIGAGNVFLSHQAAGSTATNRLINIITSSTTPLAAVVGTATYVYDSTSGRWRLIRHEQGGFITYTPALTNITIGNGTVAGRYYVRGLDVRIEMKVTAGSTTTFGAGGSFTYSVPYTASAPYTTYPVSNATGYHVGTGLSTGAIGLNNGASTFAVSRVTDLESANGWNNSTPFVWSSGDYMAICAIYATS
jgi:hypothetical protein